MVLTGSKKIQHGPELHFTEQRSREQRRSTVTSPTVRRSAHRSGGRERRSPRDERCQERREMAGRPGSCFPLQWVQQEKTERFRP